MSQTGLVVSVHGRHAMVDDAAGQRWLCHARGKKSDCVVGDRVKWNRTGDEGVVEAVEQRRNLLFRQDEWKTKAFAANLDQILMVVASEPVFSESQLGRALVAAEDAAITARVLLNKCDLPQTAAARQRLAPYTAMGYDVVEVALKADPEASLARLQPLLAGKVTLVLGPSGSGKSTLINVLVPGAKAQVGEISHALQSGRHTTTSTHWHWLGPDRSGALIDSPGFQEFGLRHIAADRLAGLMPDLAARVAGCRFYNCTHLHEPGCAVLAAAARSEIAASRMAIYAQIRAELPD